MTDREVLEKLFAAALAAVDPRGALLPHLIGVRELYRREKFDRLLVAGFGKGGLPMALAADEILGGEIAAGLVIVPHGAATGRLPERIGIAEGSHPHPGASSVAATERLVTLVKDADARTLLLLLISGGGSALFCAPAEGITLEEKRTTSRLLMEASADIKELNTVRKHLSSVKGGHLAALAHPARVVVLAVSDVPGDGLDVIASGPAFPDPTTFADALSVLHRFRLTKEVPPRVLERLSKGERGHCPETPKPGDPVFAGVTTAIVAGNHDARRAAAREADVLKLKARLREELVCGEARDAGKALAALARKERKALHPGERLCLISGGETTVKVTGSGKGGRNQELALSFALAIRGEEGIALLSAGTDGIDGPTDAAGAVVDGTTISHAAQLGMEAQEYLDRNDAYPFLERCGVLLKTGATGTNVMDVQIVLISR